MSVDWPPAQWFPAVETAYTATNGRRIDMLVMHATAGRETGDLYTLSGRDKTHLVSTHYYITKAGACYQLVRDRDIAWHAGVTWWQGEEDANRYSIGVELENLQNGRDPYPQVQMQVTTTLVRAKVKQYDIPESRLVTHAQIAQPPGRKTDPDGFNMDMLRRAAYALDPTLTERWVSLSNGVYVREAPTTKSPIAWNGTFKLWAGQVVGADKIVTGETLTRMIDGTRVTSDRWLHIIDPASGFSWIPQFETVA